MQLPPTHATYRGDIDGLRAIAVLSVVLFHAGVPHTSGGFVGVDVFFVISGFLISQILQASIEQQRFSILHFYDGRVRRIAPAFGFMALGTATAAIAILTPFELEEFGKSLIAAATFSSNFWFWQVSPL
jgi:peptidoglycan/LPS O-acetylase OafA/YrhL